MIAAASSTIAPLALVCALVYVAAACRFLAYRPNGARHRPAVSLLACGLIAALLCRAAEILLCQAATGLPELCIGACICAAAWRARGNVAALLRGCANG
ncbi:phage holin family protein [Bordetella sp. 2513F-2]